MNGAQTTATDIVFDDTLVSLGSLRPLQLICKVGILIIGRYLGPGYFRREYWLLLLFDLGLNRLVKVAVGRQGCNDRSLTDRVTMCEPTGGFALILRNFFLHGLLFSPRCRLFIHILNAGITVEVIRIRRRLNMLSSLEQSMTCRVILLKVSQIVVLIAEVTALLGASVFVIFVLLMIDRDTC